MRLQCKQCERFVKALLKIAETNEGKFEMRQIARDAIEDLCHPINDEDHDVGEQVEEELDQQWEQLFGYANTVRDYAEYVKRQRDEVIAHTEQLAGALKEAAVNLHGFIAPVDGSDEQKVLDEWASLVDEVQKIRPK